MEVLRLILDPMKLTATFAFAIAVIVIGRTLVRR